MEIYWILEIVGWKFRMKFYDGNLLDMEIYWILVILGWKFRWKLRSLEIWYANLVSKFRWKFSSEYFG